MNKEKREIGFLDCFHSIVDKKTQSIQIFSTKLDEELSNLIGNRKYMSAEVIENVVDIFNKSNLEELDEYLLDEGRITQDEREIIIESLYNFLNNN